jgi:hypothetical protein
MSATAVASVSNATLDELLTLICHQLQISDAQHAQAESRYRHLELTFNKFGSSFVPHQASLYPQGSLRIGTTVQPIWRKEFDLDLVCELETEARHFPDPTVLIHGMANYLNAEPAYMGRVEKKSRCVRIKYPDQFYIDVLPACRDPFKGGTHLVVPDRDSKNWKVSNPKGYAEWFDFRSQFTGKFIEGRAEAIPPKEPVFAKSTLKLCTQLMKRQRDIAFASRKEIAPISIVLTTLAGSNYRGTQSVGLSLFEILQGIVGQIPPHRRLVVLNPVNAQEDLSEKWDKNQQAYEAFCVAVRNLCASVQQLFEPQPLDKLCKRLGALFGEDVSSEVVKHHARSLEESRSGNNLHVRRHSGVLTSVAAATTTRVRPHTFYGD